MGVLKTTGSNLFTLKVCNFQYWPVSLWPAPAQLLIKSRDYLLHLPVDYDESKAYPVVMDFHGYYFLDVLDDVITGFNSVSNIHGFIAVSRAQGWVVVFVVSYFSSTDVSMSLFCSWRLRSRDAMIQPMSQAHRAATFPPPTANLKSTGLTPIMFQLTRQFD
jgi:hypothetical protein